MRNLILLFIRNGGALVFWGLEILCFFLIIQFNDAQGDIYFSSLNNANGWMDKKTDNLQDYINLKDTNDSLAIENARLLNQLRFQRVSSPPPDSLPFFSPSDSAYQFIPARVIKNSVNRANNYLRLDVGKANGVERNMGVVSPDGVVGVVIDVSQNYALVMSMLHQQTRVSASIANKGYFGSLRWTGRSPIIADLTDVPKHARIETGDLVQTSGYSLIFPPQLALGRIEEFNVGEGSSSYDIKVRLLNDLSNLQYAYVVRIPELEEQENLEPILRNE